MSENKSSLTESEKLTKLRQLIFHFNNSLANLKSIFAIWESMNDKRLISKINKNASAYTYQQIRHSLLLSCTIDIANLAKDSDERSLSLVNIMELINDKEIKTALLNIRKSTKNEISFSVTTPPKAILEELDSERTSERVSFFNESLKKLNAKYEDTLLQEKFKQFLTIRNRIAAHKDLYNQNGELLLFSTKPVEINFEDIGKCINHLEEFNNLLHAVV